MNFVVHACVEPLVHGVPPSSHLLLGCVEMPGVATTPTPLHGIGVLTVPSGSDHPESETQSLPGGLGLLTLPRMVLGLCVLEVV